MTPTNKIITEQMAARLSPISRLITEAAAVVAAEGIQNLTVNTPYGQVVFFPDNDAELAAMKEKMPQAPLTQGQATEDDEKCAKEISATWYFYYAGEKPTPTPDWCDMHVREEIVSYRLASEERAVAPWKECLAHALDCWERGTPHIPEKCDLCMKIDVLLASKKEAERG